MKIEIDDEDSPSMEINGETQIKLTGEVDRDLTDCEVDIESVKVIK